ncbi:FAD-dependent thymidylate synthase [Treponema sp. OMZ 792]|uniref:FAD-dependent thymidylate synthase n=1 Tax=unclassified Treponema TaxID=2638727 RepID=UPI0020A477DE|nr:MULTISPECIES: FAD-dependent thymidylate synthase [unclassified Treponema]UTC62549.1 FAD-dependent thymidylate synthase [Treponema sp. OMZ 787]UTC74868.1 FAD-dependent thymidylate synthase [Treponema sp. OMZ 792]UTC76789.1 FAD-dependent thymidylate synthase [Treponema sp. OMZ 799]UTC81261.1 FAD-dependent thymidylate synthase [Treponema sp. OMZ 798]
MAHCIAPEAEKILDKEFKVLDKGFIRLVDYMGTDARIVQAARVSYGEGTKTVREDAALIDYLLRNKHTSPFEQVVFTFHVKLPIFVARQWIRHRTARLNEISGRYSILKAEFYVPDGKDISLQSSDNKQGRMSEAVSQDLQNEVISSLQKQQEEVYDGYCKLLDKNIARELARINLPLSTYTEWYWQIDLHNLFHFLRLRMDAHAQKEIRDYAEVMFEICKTVAPLACASFERHEKNGVNFSAEELEAIHNLIAGKESGLKGKELERFNEKLKSGRQV